MNFQQWVTLAGIVCTIVVTVTTWGFLTGKWSTSESGRVSRLIERMDALEESCERRFDNANRECSKAMGFVQACEERFKKEFANGPVTEERFAENHRDHERFTRDIENERRANKRRSGD